MHYNMDKSWKHYDRWKLQDTKGHVVFKIVFMLYV